MSFGDPYHEGERQVQERAGERAAAVRNARVINDAITLGAIDFLSKQPMVVVGSVDNHEHVWASVLVGQPGLARAVDSQTVVIDRTQIEMDERDPLWIHVDVGNIVGLVFVEFSTRRRLRVNGEIARDSDGELTIRVLESYPNCPKYIQRRIAVRNGSENDESLSARGVHSGEVKTGVDLGVGEIEMIRSADTFFVASRHPERGVDVSHRGGAPGFVEVVGDGRLRVPDYAGNGMFNTLGNLAVNPRAGLVFWDFDRGLALQLSGEAEIRWDRDAASGGGSATNRSWEFRVERWRLADSAGRLRWEFEDYSPYNP